MLVPTWKNSVIVAFGGIQMTLSSCAFKSLYSIEKIKQIIICTKFNRKPCKKIVSCYGSTNASDEKYINTFFKEPSSLVEHILNHNVQIIGRNVDAHTDNDGNGKC